jgi:hypothetical protein
LIANTYFYGVKNQLKSHELSWKRKIILYKALIRPVLTYASETWVLTISDEKRSYYLSEKILGSICSPVKDNNE